LVSQKTDDAIAEYRHTLALDPDNLESQTKLGEAYAQKGELNAAIDQFQQVLEDDPENVDVLAVLGHAYYLNNDLSSAVTTHKHALSIQPDFPAAQNELARIYATGADQAAVHPVP